MPTITQSNPKALSTLALNLKQLVGVVGKVGWFSSAKYEDGTPVAYVASIQELGYGPIPPRLGMRTTSIEKRDDWNNVAREASKQVLRGNISAVNAMGMLTLKAEGDVAQHISQVTAPPLSPITIELRAMKKANPGLVITAATVGRAAARVREPGYVTPDVSTKPLNDTGHLIATLTSTTEKV